MFCGPSFYTGRFAQIWHSKGKYRYIPDFRAIIEVIPNIQNNYKFIHFKYTLDIWVSSSEKIMYEVWQTLNIFCMKYGHVKSNLDFLSEVCLGLPRSTSDIFWEKLWRWQDQTLGIFLYGSCDFSKAKLRTYNGCTLNILAWNSGTFMASLQTFHKKFKWINLCPETIIHYSNSNNSTHRSNTSVLKGGCVRGAFYLM